MAGGLHDEPTNPFFDAVGRFCIERRWVVIALTLLAGVGGIWLTLSRATIDTSVERFSAADSPARLALEDYRDTFGMDAMYFLVVEGDVFTLPFLERLRALHEEAASIDMTLPSIGQRHSPPSLVRDVVRDTLRAARGEPEVAAPKTAEPAQAEPAQSGSEKAGSEKAGSEKAGSEKAATDDGFAFDDSGSEGGFGEDGFGDAGDDGFDFDSDQAGDDGWGDEVGGSVIEEVTSLINARRTSGEGGGIAVGEWFDPWPSAAELGPLRTLILDEPTLVGQVVGAEGRHTVIVLRTQFMSEGDMARVYDRLMVLAEAHSTDGFQVGVGGVPALNAGLQDLLLNDLGTLTVFSMLVMFLVLGFLFRHPLGIFPPLVVVALSAVLMVAFMGAIDMSLTLMTNVLPAFLFCVCIGHSVHIISVYRDGMRDGLSHRDALRMSVGTTGVPVFYTSLTTMVGLLSFEFATLGVISEMGEAGAFGVFMAFVLSVTFLPAMLSFNEGAHPMGAKPPGEDDFIDRLLNVCNSISGLVDDPGTGPEPAKARGRRRRAVLAMVVLFGIGVYGTSTLQVWHNPLSWLPEESPMRVAFETMDEHVGGTGNVQLLIDAPEGGTIKDLELMTGLDQLQTHIRDFVHPDFGEIVGNTIGVLDIVKETNRALNGDKAEWYRLPESDGGVNDLMFMFENAGPDQLRRLATIDMTQSQITIRVKWLEATRYRSLVEHIEGGIESFVPDGVTVRPTGSVYTIVTTIGTLLIDLIRSFGSAFIVITFIMMFLLRGLKLGLIAMVPNLMPIVMIMAIMAFSGIPIDMNNLMIASISIGIAVDDTIHFLHHWRVNMEQFGNAEIAIRRAMRHSGRAMVSTTVILMLGFSAYLGASMYNIQRFGFLVGLTAVMALLIDLIFAPALLRTFYARAAAASEPEEPHGPQPEAT